MAQKKRGMDALDDLCGDDSDDSSAEDDLPVQKKPAAAGAASKLSIDALQRAGYQAGPSVLHVPEQRQAAPESTWEWSQGKRNDSGGANPTSEEREFMRQATSVGVAADATYSRKLTEQAEKLRAEKREEKEARAKRGGLSFKEKEKKKRNTGMQASAKNYVEEEKRRAREAGVYTGFDS